MLQPYIDGQISDCIIVCGEVRVKHSARRHNRAWSLPCGSKYALVRNANDSCKCKHPSLCLKRTIWSGEIVLIKIYYNMWKIKGIYVAKPLNRVRFRANGRCTSGRIQWGGERSSRGTCAFDYTRENNSTVYIV